MRWEALVKRVRRYDRCRLPLLLREGGGKHAIGLSRFEGRGPVLQGSLIGDGSTETRVGGA